MTLPDLFVIRIGTAKGTASHEMMHERVGSTRPNTAGGGGGKIRVAQFEAQRGASRCCREQEEWAILGEAEEEKARNRFLSSWRCDRGR